ncbi:MAG: GTPase, partial [Gemmatirosa sp.]
ELKFVGGMASVDGWRPDTTLPEIAFAGRSNVGKSSLLNKLVKRKAIALRARPSVDVSGVSDVDATDVHASDAAGEHTSADERRAPSRTPEARPRSRTRRPTVALDAPTQETA